jgi:hypothetical protein
MWDAIDEELKATAKPGLPENLETAPAECKSSKKQAVIM